MLRIGFGKHEGGSGSGCWPGFGKGVCKRTDDQVHNAAYNQTISEVGNRPGPFTEPEPIDEQGDYYHQSPIQMTANISCCANLVNIQGTGKNIAQSCQQSLDQAINTKESQLISKPTTSTTSTTTFAGTYISDNFELSVTITIILFMSCGLLSLISSLFSIAK